MYRSRCLDRRGIGGPKRTRNGRSEQDRFGAVAMMNIEVEHRHPAHARRPGFQHGNGHRVQVTESHRAIGRRVMARRTQQAEGLLSLSCQAQGVEGTTHTALRVSTNVRMRRCVQVEITGHIQSLQVPPVVGALELRFRHRTRLSPRQLKRRLGFEPFHRQTDALGPFRMPKLLIRRTTIVRDDDNSKPGFGIPETPGKEHRTSFQTRHHKSAAPGQGTRPAGLVGRCPHAAKRQSRCIAFPDVLAKPQTAFARSREQPERSKRGTSGLRSPAEW